MKHLILASLIALTAAPVMAQLSDPPQEVDPSLPDAAPGDEPGIGRNLMEEGARLLLRGLLSEAEPALRELENFAGDVAPAMRLLGQEMGPALAQIMAQIDDIGNYDAPVLLPNGDILMRRSPDAPRFVPQPRDAAPAPEFDL
ncbi:hypothetical protein SAMN04488003_1139 [Loktanella fryxellensis]|uniref:AAA+ family ATPase n=1 Tax=Loktanella fryxellensis TaxID=245187 RepID=A0A1H8FGV2_9RHOB|nr:hypothetical protein [Loktanella fryxellensis]SEN30840.1 hypothetical protein SAMN04488003_1139 [Loktanella fryxellensis]